MQLISGESWIKINYTRKNGRKWRDRATVFFIMMHQISFDFFLEIYPFFVIHRKKWFEFLSTFCNDISSFLINSILTLKFFNFLQIKHNFYKLFRDFFLLKLIFFLLMIYFLWFFGFCFKKNGFIYIILIKWSNKKTFVWFFSVWNILQDLTDLKKPH